jgi:uncharacterized protein (DUF2461 family)
VQVGREFLDALSTRLGLPGKMMRIFKDVRFSKDKTPYKPRRIRREAVRGTRPGVGLWRQRQQQQQQR